MSRSVKYFIAPFLYSLLVTCASALAQPPDIKFKKISSEQGLSNSTIETIFQDSRGFMWFGTRDGLNKYDGYQVTVYRYHSKDSTSISDNYVRCIFEDRNGKLWVGTTNGLNCFDPVKNHFTRFKHRDQDPKTIAHNHITGIAEDRKGNLWISSHGGLQVYNRDENSFAVFPAASDTFLDVRINCLYIDSKDRIWAGTEKGLGQFERAGKKLVHAVRLPQTGIYNIEEDKAGNLWLGTEENGLIKFNPVEKGFVSYRHQQLNASSLASNQVRSILTDKKGNIWVGCINGGLNLFSLRINGFYHYQNEPANPQSLSQRTVSALFEDRQGNLWVGTHRGGVNLYTPNTEKFLLYRQGIEANSLSYNDVKTFCEDSEGNIWIGTDGGGLNLFNREKNSFKHYRNNPYDPHSLASNEVLHVTEDSEKNLWICTWGGGLNLLNRTTGRFTRFVNQPNNPKSISSNYVQKVFEDSRKNLWVATYYGGLNLFDQKTKSFTRIIDAPDGKSRLQGNNIVSITEDRSGTLWFGTDDGGLNSYDPVLKKFQHYFDKEEKAPDLRVLFTDRTGRLWVGQAGLYLFDAVKKKFSIFTNKAALNTEFIKGIAEDQQGHLWISTSNGLTQFHPESGSFKKYNTSDGLQGLEFEANAYLQTKDGQLFFGGVNGFNSFYPAQIQTNRFVPPVVLTEFYVFNQKLEPGKKSPLQTDIGFAEEIVLNYKQSTISFGFAALNFTAAENNQYAYKLEGLEKEWNNVGNQRRAVYTNLSPGTYTFRVKACNNDGIWNDEGTSVKIIITPPFWKTWWFTSLVVLLVVAMAISYYQFKRKQEIKKLEEKKKEEMHQMQLQFFTNISHELRTPLSLILGPLEKLQKENHSFAFQHYYKIIHRNASRLTGLVNELMDFRKVEAGSLKLKVMPGNLTIFLQEIADEFIELAHEKQIDFNVRVLPSSEEVWFDRQVLEKIIINLVSNAFKYTAEKGKIELQLFSSLEAFQPAYSNELTIKNEYRGKKYCYIRVADNGIGISGESLPHLFERYYKITESHLGSGIGLAFVKSLTLLHKGYIQVHSERNRGTEILIALPVSKDDYTQKERWIKSTEGDVRLESIPYKYEQPLPEEKKFEASAPSTVKKQVLIVDDNAELRTFLQESLQPHYQILQAADGLAGLQKAKEHFPDLVISDIMMPQMNGIEFCKSLKENIETSHIPFMMLTAKNGLDTTLESVDSGADFYFAKPVSIDLLLLTMRNIFDQRQKLKDRYLKDVHAEAKELVHSAKDKAFLEELLSIIESQLTNPDLDVDFICTNIGMSRTKLYQKIKSITGQSIGDFVRTIRLKKAIEIMTHEDVLLTEVMFRVGIQTQSYFTKAFKKEFGKTPTQFLQELRK